MPSDELTADRIEKTKLLANYLNGLAIAVFAVGALAPTLAFLNDVTTRLSTVLAAEVMICLAVSVLLHSAGRRSLRKLAP